jgi:hypothetical protein
MNAGLKTTGMEDGKARLATLWLLSRGVNVERWEERALALG